MSCSLALEVVAMDHHRVSLFFIFIFCRNLKDHIAHDEILAVRIVDQDLEQIAPEVLQVEGAQENATIIEEMIQDTRIHEKALFQLIVLHADIDPPARIRTNQLEMQELYSLHNYRKISMIKN